MLSVPHVLTGAFVASQLPHPGLYVPIILSLHYLQDWIPHWDFGTGLSNGKRSRKAAFLMEIGDLILAFGLVYWLFQSAHTDWQLHIWVGAVIGILPDLLEAPRNFLRWEPAFLKPINDLHADFHHSMPHKLLGLAPQLAVVLIIVWLS